MATMKTLNGYGFNATELNGKTASDYLQKTDTATNSAKLGGKAPEYYIQPRNLLDNSDFRNPVNQRGQTSYEIVGGFYNIDRWVNWLETSDITSHIIVQDGYITVETGGKLQQKLASYKQNTIYTAAAKRTDGTVLIVSGMFSNVEIGEDIFIKTGSDGIPNVGLRSGDYLWAALYEGSYTAETLPPYVPKGYAAELAECKRYYELLNNGSSQFVRAYNSSTIAFVINYAEKRIGPTISVTGSLANALSVAGIGTNTPTSIGSAYPVGLKSARINAAGTFDTSYTYSIIYNIAKLEINADM